MSTPNWVQPGAPCVLLQRDDHRNALRAEDAVIDRVLNRDIVVKLTTGRRAGQEERFRRADLSRHDGGTWGTMVYLVAPDDERVPVVREKLQRRRLRALAATAYENWNRGKADPSEVSAAFWELAAFENQASQP